MILLKRWIQDGVLLRKSARWGAPSYDPELTGALRDLAEYGKIDRRVKNTGAPLRVRSNKPPREREIEFYRLPQ
jgi:hypothetical protein